MPRKSETRCIGILTSGGDCPGLNAAIRAVVKPALNKFGMKVVGFLDGFRGLVENRCIDMNDQIVSGILTEGGTILGTSRDKPHKMPMAGKVMDMINVAVENARKHQVDCLVCLGGGGTQKNAMRLSQAGLNVLTLPKTIDNDVAETEITFGFDTAMGIATEAIDRLHTTATSHHRIILCEIMGHTAGWLPLGAGVAGGADVILIPEIPYNLERVADHLCERRRSGKRFSIIAIAEGAISCEEAALEKSGKLSKVAKKKLKKESRPMPLDANLESVAVDIGGEKIEYTYHRVEEPKVSRIARELQRLTGMEARVTSLGHVQRGGSPSATDRLLCTRLGTMAAELLAKGELNVMVGVHKRECLPIPLERVAGNTKLVPPNHEWVIAARNVGTCFGD